MIEVGRGVKDLILLKAKRGGLRKQETNGEEKKKSDEDERSQDTATSGRGVEEDHMFTLCLHRIQKQEEGGKKRGEEGVEEMGEEIKEKGEITPRQRAYGTRGE